MIKLKKISVRESLSEEVTHSAYGGEYKDKDGKKHYLTKTQAVTFSCIQECKNVKEQFEFFVYAFRRENAYPMIKFINDEKLTGYFKTLSDKYGFPWSGKGHVLPWVKDYNDSRIFLEDKFNIELLKEEFNKYGEYEFIIYKYDEGYPFKRLNPVSDNPYWDFEVGNYDVYCNGLQPAEAIFAVPKYASDEQRRRFLAASISMNLRLSSMDYALRMYAGDAIDVKVEDLDYDQLIKVLRELVTFLNNYKECNCTQGDKDIMGIIAAEAALNRCRATFYSIFCLIGRGYFIEALILCRHIIEQCSWAYAVKDMRDIKQIENENPTKTINKCFYPNTGKLYGDLSDFVHLPAKKRSDYYRIRNGKAITLLRSNKHMLRYIPLVILTLDLYICTIESICLNHHVNGLSSWKKNSKNNWRLNSDRKLWQIFKKHRSKLYSKKLYEN